MNKLHVVNLNDSLMITTHVFILYIAGESVNSQMAQRNIKAYCDKYYESDYQIKLVDVLLSPEQAWNEGVTATPMLVRVLPLPSVKILGNLSNIEQLNNILTNFNG